jgi:hypothetical protein
MIQRRDGLGFAVQPCVAIGIGGIRFRQHFDRDLPVQPRVDGAVDLAHAARAKQAENLV